MIASTTLRWHPVARVPHRTKKSKGGNRYAIKIQRKQQKKREFPFPFDIRPEPVVIEWGTERVTIAEVVIVVQQQQIIIRKIFIQQIEFAQSVGRIAVERVFQSVTFWRSVEKPQHLGTFFFAGRIVARQHTQKFGIQQTADGS